MTEDEFARPVSYYYNTETQETLWDRPQAGNLTSSVEQEGTTDIAEIDNESSSVVSTTTTPAVASSASAVCKEYVKKSIFNKNCKHCGKTKKEHLI